MGFPLALLPSQAQAQLFECFDALSSLHPNKETQTISCRHIFVYFSLHTKLIQPGRRDEKRKGRRIFCLFLRGKGDGGSRGAPLLPVAFHLALLLLNISYSHSLSCPPVPSPPNPDPSLHLLGEEEVGNPLSPSLRERRRRIARRSSSSRCSCFSSTPTLVLLLVDCCVCPFRSISRTSSELHPSFHCPRYLLNTARILGVLSKRLIVKCCIVAL